MDQDATWYGDRPRPRRHCVRWGPSSPPHKNGGRAAPTFWSMYCGQTAGWIKMPLGTEIDLGPGDFVLDGDPAPSPQKRDKAPNFWPMSIVAKRLDASRWHLAWRWSSAQATLCYMRTQLPRKRDTAAPFSAHVYSGQTAVCITIPLGTVVGLSLGDIVLDGDPDLPHLKGHSLPIFDPCPLWPNGWIDESAT